MTLVDSQRTALQTIFSFFLGLMVAAFVGVGANTFYRSPSDQYLQQKRETSRRTEVLSRHPDGALTAAEQAKLDSLMDAQNALHDREEAEVKDWARVTSVILVICATIVLVVSLLLSEQLRVISNGLLLGGLFTMLYGVGWVIFSRNSVTRFWVIAFALAVAVGLGYMRFVRGRRSTAPPGGASAATHHAAGAVADPAETGLAIDAGDPIHGADVAALAARVRALEERISAASASLAGNEDDRKR